MSKFPDMFGNWNQYDCAKALVSRLEAADKYEAFMEIIESRCNFDEIVNSHATIQHMYNLCLCFYSDTFAKVVDTALLHTISFESFKMCVPLKPSGDGADRDLWHFAPNCSVTEGVDGFKKPMGGSVTYKKRKLLLGVIIIYVILQLCPHPCYSRLFQFADRTAKASGMSHSFPGKKKKKVGLGELEEVLDDAETSLLERPNLQDII